MPARPREPRKRWRSESCSTGCDDLLRTRHYSTRTESSYVQLARRYILFHGKRHLSVMGSPEINAILSHLAVEFERLRLHAEPAMNDLVRAPHLDRLPVVLTRDEVRLLLGAISGTARL